MIHNSKNNPLGCLSLQQGDLVSMFLGAALENIKLRLISNWKHTSIYEISIELVERCTSVGH
jgi:hypothetical protein